VRKSQRNTEPGELVDRLGELEKEAHELEKRARAARNELIRRGALRIAREYLTTPTKLRDLANFLFYDEPLVTTFENASKSKADPSALNFPKKFKMERCNVSISLEERLAKWMERVPENDADAIVHIAAEKAKNKVTERFRFGMVKTAEMVAKLPEIFHGKQSDLMIGGDYYEAKFTRAKLIRAQAIETAWLYPLEEWAMIFPDAALAGDHDFIKQVVERCSNPPRALDLENTVVAVSWHGFEWLGISKQAPPLRHWSDQAAREFVTFTCGKELTEPAYKNRKNDMRLRSNKPTLVSFAEIKNDQLICKR